MISNIKYYKKQPEEFFAEWNEGNLLLIMARDLKSITIKITKSGLNITEILERTKRIYGNVRDRYFDGDRTKNTIQYRLNHIHKKCGYNPREFQDAVRLYLALKM